MKTKDIDNALVMALQENNRDAIGELLTSSSNSIKTEHEYYEHQIFKIWDVFIQSKELKYLIETNQDEAVLSETASIFKDLNSLKSSYSSAIIIDNAGSLYKNGDGLSVSIIESLSFENTSPRRLRCFNK